MAWSLGACAGPAREGSAGPLRQAAAEATAIVERAQATALVQRAQAQATALIAGARASPTAPQARQQQPAPSVTETQPPAADQPSPTISPDPTTSEQGLPTAVVTDTTTVTIASVALAADGALLIINFRAPPQVATRWYQGAVSLTDEATGVVYNEIPVLPVVGPLFGKPVEPGQPGYVMLVNRPTPLSVGARVTVVLGDHRFEHLLVQ